MENLSDKFATVCNATRRIRRKMFFSVDNSSPVKDRKQSGKCDAERCIGRTSTSESMHK